MFEVHIPSPSKAPFQMALAFARTRASPPTAIFNTLLRRSAATSSSSRRLYASSGSLSRHPPPNSPPPSTVKPVDGDGDGFEASWIDPTSQIGRCMLIREMRIGTYIHHIEMRPGQGSKLVRAGGSYAKIVKEPTSKRVLVELPSGRRKLLLTSCRALITTSTSNFTVPKLYKAGQNRWRGIRPHVRGVAMNPVDHPHGGGEGKSKSSGSFGKTSRTPWGKPCKCGYKTGPLRRKNKKLRRAILQPA